MLEAQRSSESLPGTGGTGTVGKLGSGALSSMGALALPGVGPAGGRTPIARGDEADTFLAEESLAACQEEAPSGRLPRAIVQVPLAAHAAREELLECENRLLEAQRRALERRLRLSEQRRLQLERENQALQAMSYPASEPLGKEIRPAGQVQRMRSQPLMHTASHSEALSTEESSPARSSACRRITKPRAGSLTSSAFGAALKRETPCPATPPAPSLLRSGSARRLGAQRSSSASGRVGIPRRPEEKTSPARPQRSLRDGIVFSTPNLRTSQDEAEPLDLPTRDLAQAAARLGPGRGLVWPVSETSLGQAAPQGAEEQSISTLAPRIRADFAAAAGGALAGVVGTTLSPSSASDSACPIPASGGHSARLRVDSAGSAQVPAADPTGTGSKPRLPSRVEDLIAAGVPKRVATIHQPPPQAGAGRTRSPRRNASSSPARTPSLRRTVISPGWAGAPCVSRSPPVVRRGQSPWRTSSPRRLLPGAGSAGATQGPIARPGAGGARAAE